MTKIPRTLCRLRFESRSPSIRPEQFTAICDAVPNLVDKFGTWELKQVPPEDPRIIKALEVARMVGIVIPDDSSWARMDIAYRIYPETLEWHKKQSPLKRAVIRKGAIAETRFRADYEPYVLNGKVLRAKRHLDHGSSWAWGNLMFVREPMMQRLVAAGLSGLSFRRVELAEDRPKPEGFVGPIPWPADIPPLYQIYSDIELPHCKNWMFDNVGRVFHPQDRDCLPDGCMPLNGRGPAVSYHYAKDEIDPYLKYDIVRSYERTWNCGPFFWVSERFLRIGKELGMKWLGQADYYMEIDEKPWELGVDGPRHPRYSGPYPNSPVVAWYGRPRE